MRLLDANILIYAFGQNTAQHEKIMAWVNKVYDTDHRVLVPMTSIHAYLRVATNPRVTTNPLTVPEAIRTARPLLDNRKTHIPEPGRDYWAIFESLAVQSKLVASGLSDVHLAALAIEQGAVLCSTDRDFLRFPGLRTENPLD